MNIFVFSVFKAVYRRLPSNNMIGDEATKIIVFHPDIHGELEVFLKMVKDGRAVITRA